jgi:hypothetical protein
MIKRDLRPQLPVRDESPGSEQSRIAFIFINFINGDHHHPLPFDLQSHGFNRGKGFDEWTSWKYFSLKLSPLSAPVEIIPWIRFLRGFSVKCSLEAKDRFADQRVK